MGEVVMEVDAEERKLKKNEEKDGSIRLTDLAFLVM